VQSTADAEVVGVVDRGLGAQGGAELVVLLDLGVLVVDVQARGDPFGDYPGAEPSRGGVFATAADLPVEDQPDPGADSAITGKWRVQDTYLRLRAPGCYGLQVDAADRSTVIVFAARQT
jgi:hypothetical protein